jgi:hypothetical protein
MTNLVDDLLELGYDLKQVKAALEDGSWQSQMGILQEESEEAYADVIERIKTETGKKL